jgi:hypothetical protein
MIFLAEPAGLEANGHKAMKGAALIDGNSNKPTSCGLLGGAGCRAGRVVAARTVKLLSKVPAKHACSRSICLEGVP